MSTQGQTPKVRKPSWGCTCDPAPPASSAGHRERSKQLLEANPGQLETESIPGFTPNGQLGRPGQPATSSELVRAPRTGRPEGWRNCPSCRARRKGEPGRKRCYFLAQENKTHFWRLAPPLPHFWPRARSEVPGSGRCTKLLRPWGQGPFIACTAVNSSSPPAPVLWAPAPYLYTTGGLGWLQGHRGGWQTLNSYHSYQHSRERWEKSSSQGRYHACENNELRIVCKPVTRLLLFGCSTLHPFPNQNVQIHLLFGQSPIYKRVFFFFKYEFYFTVPFSSWISIWVFL